MLRPERIRHAAQDEELQGVLGAREGFVRGEELAPAPLQFRPRLGDLGLGRRARLHPGPRLTELFLGQAHRLLAYIDLLARRHERPVGALDRRHRLRDRAVQRRRRALAVGVGHPHGEARRVGPAIAKERLPQLGAHACPVGRRK